MKCNRDMSSSDKFIILFIIFVLLSLTSVSSNTTANTSVFGERIPRTTSSDILNTIGDNVTTDLATDSTNWPQEVRTLVTETTDGFDVGKRTTINDRYSVSLSYLKSIELKV